MAEYKLPRLSEKQQRAANTISDMISRGEMPPLDELRAMPRNVLACGCPEHLLRSVVEKNAAVTRARATSPEIRSSVAPGEKPWRVVQESETEYRVYDGTGNSWVNHVPSVESIRRQRFNALILEL